MTISRLTLRNRLLKAIASDDLARLEPHFEPVALKVREVLVVPNRPIEHVYFLRRGSPPPWR